MLRFVLLYMVQINARVQTDEELSAFFWKNYVNSSLVGDAKLFHCTKLTYGRVVIAELVGRKSTRHLVVYGQPTLLLPERGSPIFRMHSSPI